MTKEQIEQAAIEFTDDKCQKRGCPKTYRLHFDFDRRDIEQAFESGANWRINSMWHGASEYPIANKTALVKYLTGDGEIKYRVDVFCGYEWREMCHYDKLIQFAYIEDLLPNKED
jgi:hypothetical protein